MDKKELTIILNNPDFNTAARAAQAINSQVGESIARPIDPGTLSLKVIEKFQGKVVNLIAQIGDLEVEPDCVAKVIVNEKTGTVVVGENVRIQKVAVAHGNLSIQIKETKQVSQPLPFAPCCLVTFLESPSVIPILCHFSPPCSELTFALIVLQKLFSVNYERVSVTLTPTTTCGEIKSMSFKPHYGT